jgi:uncharacterized membrane protein
VNPLSDKQVIIALYPNEAAADSAVAGLKTWDKEDDQVKLGAVGVLVLDEKGQVKTEKMGRRSWGKGAGIGLVLGLLTPVGLVVGAVGGGLLGALHHKGLGLSEQDRDRIAAALRNGQAAVGVLCEPHEADAVTQKLKEFGGEPEVHDVPDAAMQEAENEVAKTE